MFSDVTTDDFLIDGLQQDISSHNNAAFEFIKADLPKQQLQWQTCTSYQWFRSKRHEDVIFYADQLFKGLMLKLASHTMFCLSIGEIDFNFTYFQVVRW